MNRSQTSRPPMRGIALKTPLLVGGARNVHGTRICKRVKCEKCGVEDYITSRPKSGKETWCRSCAQELLHAFDSGVRIPTPLVKKRCGICACIFDLPVTARVKGPRPLCSNCMKGFEVWQGSLDMSPQMREQMTLESRRSGTMLRKRNDATKRDAAV
jgi:hypothetical protein